MNRSVFQAAGIVLLSGAVYAQTLGFGFVWDDARNIVNNPGLGRAGALLQTVTNLNPQHLTYRPLLDLSFALDYKLWGLSPFGFHLTNVLLHAAATFLVLQVVLCLTTSSRIALSSAAIFGVHPIHTEAVAWIAGRSDLLVTLFTLLSLFSYLKSFSKTGGKAWLWMTAAWTGFALALLTKETAIVLPLLLVVGLYLVKPQNRASALIHLSVMGGLALLYLGLRGPSLAASHFHAFRETIPAAVFLIGEYLRLLIFPFPLKPLYELPVLSLGDPKVMQSLMIVIVGLVALGYAFAKESVLFAGMAWALVALMPSFALTLYNSVSPIAERLLYLPSVGFALACAAVWVKTSNRLEEKTGTASWRIPLSLLGLFLLSLATMRSNTAWIGDETLWKHAVSQSPQTVLAHRNLADYYLEQKQLQKAIEHYKQALSLKEDDVDSHYNIGIAYLDQGDLDTAIAHFKDALTRQPRHSDAYTNMAYAYHLKKRDDLALESIRKAIEANPSSAVAHNSLGNLWAVQGLWHEAAEQYRIAVALQPTYREAETNLRNAVMKEQQE
ncbi:MAG: tetratricopeptide repeat protein [Nitrospirae bacterium]|nr:tetratricopeptide repeat protein [Nitrospirota bacterium]